MENSPLVDTFRTMAQRQNGMSDAEPFQFQPGQQYAMMDDPRGPRPKPQLADQFGGGGRGTGPGGSYDVKAFRRADELRRQLGVTASTPGGQATDAALKAIEEALKLHTDIKPF